MRIENRELFVTFWDESIEAAVVTLLLGWVGDDPATLVPVVAYNYGINEVRGKFLVNISLTDAHIVAGKMKGPLG